MENSIIGTCLTMCPENELKIREREGLLDKLEMVHSTENQKKPKADISRTVKQFTRSAAGQQMQEANNLRPPPVLMYTVKYLLKELCEEHISKFDSVLNRQHLNECLKMLLILYDEFDIYKEKCPDGVIIKIKMESGLNVDNFDINYMDTRPFMEALYLLLNMDHPEPVTRCLALSKIWRNQCVNRAINISLCFRKGNWVRTCCSIKKLPPLLAAISSLHLPNIRRNAFQIMSTAYSSRNVTFPVEKLQNILLYNNSSDLLSDLLYYKVPFDEKNKSIQFLKSSFDVTRELVATRKESFVDFKFREKNISSILIYGK